MRSPDGSTVHRDFRSVAELLPRALRGGRGGALAVYHRGELVLDTWTGARDAVGDDPWQYDTVAMAWSTTKGVTSAALHLLVQRGVIDIEDRVGDHWPEFACNGKEATTVRHVLAQEAGLHDIRHLIDDARSMLDHEQMAAALASATPAYEPGTANGYHALTYGYLVDELVRRTAGRTLADVVHTEIAGPLRLDGFAIGSAGIAPNRIAPAPTFAPMGAGVRRAGMVVNAVTRIPPIRIDLAAVASAFVPHGGEVVGTPEFLAAGNGSIGGLFTARSLARFYAALLRHDGIDGSAIWSTATLHRATTQQGARRDRVLSVRPLWSLGFHRPWPRRHLGPGAFGFFGMYGSGAWADVGRDLAVALVCPDVAGLPLVRLGRAAIDAADLR